DHDQLAAGALALVFQLAPELAPAAVADRPGQVPVADHVGDREVLDRDQVVAADQAGGGLVQEVAAGVADLSVGPGYLGLRPAAAGRATLAPGQPPLVAGEVAGPALQVTGVGDPLAVRRHREAGDAQVDAGCSPGSRPGRRSARVDREGHVPAAVGLFGDEHGARVQPGHLHARPRPRER